MSESEEPRPIRIVLDTTAVVAFTRGSVSVGEVLAEVGDEQAVAAIPLVALVDAVPAVADIDRLDLLIAHRAVEVLADEPSQWRALAAVLDIVGRADAASAALLALDLDTGLLSRTPGIYAGLAAGRLVVPIED